MDVTFCSKRQCQTPTGEHVICGDIVLRGNLLKCGRCALVYDGGCLCCGKLREKCCGTLLCDGCQKGRTTCGNPLCKSPITKGQHYCEKCLVMANAMSADIDGKKVSAELQKGVADFLLDLEE